MNTSFRKNLLLFSILYIILFAGTYLPIWYRINHQIPGREYLGFNSTPIDMLGNLASVQQGYGGRWDKFSYISSSIPSKLFFIKTEYYLIGHVAKFLNTDPVLTLRYTTGVLSLILCLGIFIFIQFAMNSNSKRYVAYLIVLFATGVVFPDASIGWGKFRSDMQIFQRFTITQLHYMLSGVCLVFQLLLIAKYTSSRKNIYIYGSVLCGVIMSHVFAPAGIIGNVVLIVYLIIDYIRLRSIKSVIDNAGAFLFLIAIQSIPILYLWYAGHYFDISYLSVWEKTMLPPLRINDYFLMVGPILFFVLIGIPGSILSHSPLVRLSVSFVISHIFIVIVGLHVLPLHGLRFFQVPYMVFYGVIGGYGFGIVREFIHKIFTKVSIKIITAVVLLFLFMPSMHAYTLSIQYFTEQNNWDIYDLGYPVSSDMHAVRWLANNASSKDIILSDEYMGLILMAYTPVRSVVTYWLKVLTPEIYISIKEPKTRFFRGQMTDNEAKEYLTTNKVTFVFFGDFEKKHLFYSNGGKSLSYTCLKPVYQTAGSEIYAVRCM